MRKKYAEEFQNTSIAEDARLLREALQDIVDLEFERKIENPIFTELMKTFGIPETIIPTTWGPGAEETEAACACPLPPPLLPTPMDASL